MDADRQNQDQAEQDRSDADASATAAAAAPGPAQTPRSHRAHPRIAAHEMAAVALGGAVGALARVGIEQAWPVSTGNWPWATFGVNVAGALVLGMLLGAFRRRGLVSVEGYRLLGTGFCGTFTTFSTMQLELLRMLDNADYGLAAAYLGASVAAGYAAVWLGLRLLEGAGPAGPLGERA